MLQRDDELANESIIISAVEAPVSQNGELPEAKKWVSEDLAQ